jgi:hypothetical protein
MNRMAHALIAIAAPFCLVRAQSPTASNARRDGPEFTKQALLIIDFAPGAGADIRLGKRAADAVRSRFSKTINKRELDLVDPGAIERALERAGYDVDSVYAIAGIIPLARKLRADEIVIGRVSVQAAAPTAPRRHRTQARFRGGAVRQGHRRGARADRARAAMRERAPRW